jgi:hypothetical protein
MSYNFTFDTAKIRFLGEYQSKNCSKISHVLQQSHRNSMYLQKEVL